MSRPPETYPTERQLDVYEWIVSFIGMHGFPPSRQEISCRFGWSSPNAAQNYLEQLHDLGLINLIPGISRGIQILQVDA